MFFIGCGEEPSEPASVTPWLELGSGQSEFIDVEDGDELTLVYGIQGGWHVDGAAKFGGIDPEGASLTYLATDPDSGELLNYTYNAQLSENLLQEIEDGWLRLGDLVVFDVDSDSDVLGRTINIELTLTDADGNTMQDSRTVVVAAP